MLQRQTKDKRQKFTRAMVMLVLFLFQSAVAVTEPGTPELHSPDILEQSCAEDCIDYNYENPGSDQTLSNAAGSAHCDDCGHCFGCHLTAMVHNLTTHPISEIHSLYTYLSRLTQSRPTNIDRPPIA